MVKKETHPEIGERIRNLRELKNIDQMSLAENAWI
jgi:hypothetical protein